MSRKFILDIETTSLEPIEGVISCISLLNIDTNQIDTFSGENEGFIIETFYNFLQDQDELIGFNMLTFDINYLRVRSFINEIKLKDITINYRDVREIINRFNKYNKGKLRDYARFFNIPVETENGNTMIQFYKEKRFDDIAKHCEEDCKVTLQLYLKLKNLGFL